MAFAGIVENDGCISHTRAAHVIIGFITGLTSKCTFAILADGISVFRTIQALDILAAACLDGIAFTGSLIDIEVVTRITGIIACIRLIIIKADIWESFSGTANFTIALIARLTLA